MLSLLIPGLNMGGGGVLPPPPGTIIIIIDRITFKTMFADGALHMNQPLDAVASNLVFRDNVIINFEDG
jgi:hypothetical protein